MTSENISTVFLLENFSVVADSRGYSANCLSELHQRSRLCADRSADAADAVCQQHPQTASVFKGLLCLSVFIHRPPNCLRGPSSFCNSAERVALQLFCHGLFLETKKTLCLRTCKIN